MAYDINPTPQTYNSTFGGIPGAVGLPNPYQDLGNVYPNLSQTNQAVSSDVLAQLGGQLSPGTINLIQNQAAAWGVGTGMPGSGLAQNKGLRNLGLTAEGQVNQGLQNYRGVVPAVSGTQTVQPSLQADIASHNAMMNAAPNPQNAQNYAKQLFDQYLQSMRGPAAGTGAGSGMVTPSGGPAGNIGTPSPGAPPADPTAAASTGDIGNPFGTGAGDMSGFVDPSQGGYDPTSDLSLVFGGDYTF